MLSVASGAPALVQNTRVSPGYHCTRPARSPHRGCLCSRGYAWHSGCEGTTSVKTRTPASKTRHDSWKTKWMHGVDAQRTVLRSNGRARARSSALGCDLLAAGIRRPWHASFIAALTCRQEIVTPCGCNHRLKLACQRAYQCTHKEDKRS